LNEKQVSIILGTVCMILVFAIFVQVKTVENTTSTVGQSFAEDKLRDEVLKTQEKYEQLLAAVEKEENELELIRKQVVKDNDEATKIEEELKKVNKLLGLTDITGQGVIIKLDDNKTASFETIGIDVDISSFLVHNSDLLQVVNELWNAGAEAISINGERLVETTAIVCIGNVVSINGNKVGAPFIINAIGDPERLYGAFIRPESFLKKLSRDGVETDIKKATNIFVPKYKGAISFEAVENDN